MKNQLRYLLLASLLTSCNIGNNNAGVEKNGYSVKQVNSYQISSILGSPVFLLNNQNFVNPEEFDSCLEITSDTKLNKAASGAVSKTSLSLSMTDFQSKLSNILGIEGNLNINNNLNITEIMGELEKNKINEETTLTYYVTSTIKQAISFPDNVSPIMKQSWETMQCGKEYVNKVDAIINFIGAIHIKFDNKLDKMNAAAKISASGINDLSIEANIKLENILRDYRYSVDMSLMQTGGNPQEIFSMFNKYGPYTKESQIWLSELSPDKIPDVLDKLYGYAETQLSNQFTTNMKDSYTINDFMTRFSLNLDLSAPDATLRYPKPSIESNYNQAILQKAIQQYNNGLNELIKYKQFLSTFRSYTELLANGAEYKKLEEKLTDSLAWVKTQYQINSNQFLKEGKFDINYLEGLINSLNNTINTVNTTKYDQVFAITKSTTAAPLYLIPLGKFTDLNTDVFLSYTPLKNTIKVKYTPNVLYCLTNKVMDVCQNVIYPDFDPKYNFKLFDVTLRNDSPNSDENYISYGNVTYTLNPSEDDKSVIVPSGDKLQSTFEIKELLAFD